MTARVHHSARRHGGGVAACGARAAGGMPVIGFLIWYRRVLTLAESTAFRQGLNETGFVEGKDVAIEYRWAEGHYDRLPRMAADLVRRQVAVIVAGRGPHPPSSPRWRPSTIPIVFSTGSTR